MQLFLDTTDTAVLKDLAATGLVDGVTTNPSLIAKSGRNIAEVIAEICALVEGPDLAPRSSRPISRPWSRRATSWPPSPPTWW